jgi:hypothetical protein
VRLGIAEGKLPPIKDESICPLRHQHGGLGVAFVFSVAREHAYNDVLLENALLRVGQRYPLVSPRAAEMTHRMPARTKATLDDWITDALLRRLDYRLRFSEARPEAANSRRRMAASTYCRIRMCAVACGFLVNCWERMTQLPR